MSGRCSTERSEGSAFPKKNSRFLARPRLGLRTARKDKAEKNESMSTEPNQLRQTSPQVRLFQFQNTDANPGRNRTRPVSIASRMPVVLHVDVAKRVVISEFSGEVTNEEFMRQASLIQSHPDFDPHFSEIVDFTAVTRTSLSTETIWTMATTKSLFLPTAKHIIIAPADSAFGLARMFQTLAEDSRPNLAVVRSRSEAYRLLGLEDQGQPSSSRNETRT